MVSPIVTGGYGTGQKIATGGYGGAVVVITRTGFPRGGNCLRFDPGGENRIVVEGTGSNSIRVDNEGSE